MIDPPEESRDQAAERSRLTPSLVVGLRAGDSQVGGLLDQLYREPIQRFCYGYLRSEAEAEDATQEVFVKVLRSEVVPDDFRAWLYRIARNHCLNAVRDRGRRKDALGLPDRSIAGAFMRGPLSRFAAAEDLERLGAVLEAMPENYREVLRLRYAEQLSRKQIAEGLELPESVVKSRLFEGMKMLRQQVSTDGRE